MKFVKTFLMLILCLLATQNAFADDEIKSATENPKVDKQLDGKYGQADISLVLVCQNEVLVIFDYSVPNNVSGPWISMGSTTVLKTKSGKRKVKIRDWGYIDENDSLGYLNLDEKYNLKTGGSYKFYMAFDLQIGRENIISIYEDGYQGFYWEGIHLNKYGSYSSQGSSQSNSSSNSRRRYRSFDDLKGSQSNSGSSSGNKPKTKKNANSAESVTHNPTVDRQYPASQYGREVLTMVALGKETTLVEFKYIVPSSAPKGGWVSLSSGTILKSKSGKTKLKIKSWGYVDDNNKLQYLDFDHQYDVEQGQTYTFFMSFDRISEHTDNISIYEDGYNGFYWEGVHLNKYGSAQGNSSKKDDEQKQLAKLIVTSAKRNGVDVTKSVVNDGGTYTVFYTTKDGSFMANYAEKNDTQSWGRIYGWTTETQEETDDTYKTDISKFSWNYNNSYDNKSGTCKCTLQIIHKPQGIVSILKMVTETLDVIEYTGYLDGSVDLSNF